MSSRNLEAELLAEFGTTTFSIHDPASKALGWNGGHVDERDYATEDYLTPEVYEGRQLWANPMQLDQGEEGACVGFGHTGRINAAPNMHGKGNLFGHSLYELAKERDPWPGSDYEGTSVRAGATVCVEWGYYTNYSFTSDAHMLAFWILNEGPAVIGVDWYQGMDRVDEEGYIYPTGEVRGGHCVVVDGVSWNVEGEVPRFRIRNSWGPYWGLNGRCRIKALDM